jgi:hypothetical protein
MSVCPQRHLVGRDRHPARHLLLALGVLLGGCGEHPEQLLAGRWRESGWEYEKLATKAPLTSKWIDGIDLPAFAESRVVRHEAEYWEFMPGRDLIIAKRDGTHLKARWRLKGRGHVLTVRTSDKEFEVYDVKQLDRDQLVLNYDVGMEVRGIARLTFRRIDNTELMSSLHPAR